MKTEDFLEMLNDIDESYIHDAGDDLEKYSYQKGKTYYIEEKHNFSWKRAAAAAVCAAAVMVGMVFIAKNIRDIPIGESSSGVVLPNDSTGVSSSDSSSSDVNSGSFSFDLGMRGDSEFSPDLKKENSNTYAHVSIEDGFVSENSFIYITVYSEDYGDGREIVSESRKVTEKNINFALDYIVPRGYGSMNCLHASTGYYDAKVSGYWIP